MKEIIESQNDEEDQAEDAQEKQDDDQKDNKTKKDTSNLPVIDGEKGSAELPGAKGFVATADSITDSVFFVTKRGNVYYVPRFVEQSLKNIGEYTVYDDIDFEVDYMPGVFGKYVL